MKKIIITTLLAMFSLSGAVHAAGTGSLTGSGTVSTSATGCTWLSSDVTVSLSGNVVAAYDCATATTNQTIFIGTTSALGATKSRSESCSVTTAGDEGAGVQPVCNDTSCAATFDGSGGSVCTGTFDITGNSMFSASSAGGTVSSSQLGASCTTDDLDTCAADVLSGISALAAAAEAAAQ